MKKHAGFKVEKCGLNKKSGMNMERGCTDFLCAVIFLVFLSTMFTVGVYRLLKGQPKAMIKPYDHSKKICGFDEEVKDYGKLYLTKLAPIDIDETSEHTIMRDIFFE